MKEFKSLKIIDKFRRLYEKAGIDYDTMRLILKTKLTMDGRRTPTILKNNREVSNDSNKMLGFVMYALMGFFMAIFIIIKVNIMIQMSFFFGMFMFMIGMVFMSDFSYVLLDVRDKNILSTKGVDSKTINAAKLTHILIYIFSLSLALGGFSILASLKYGIFFTIIFIIEIILLDLLMVLVAAFLYFIILKFFDGEKLKDIINMIQIVLTITMIVMYQLIGHIFDLMEAAGGANITKWWAYLIPSFWFAAPLEIIDSGAYNKSLIILTTLAFIVPLVSILIYIRIAKSFEQYIQKLNNNTYKQKDRIPLSLKASKLLCRNPKERVFFNLINDVIKSERTFKLKTYPSLALAVIFPFIFIFPTFKHVDSFVAWKMNMENSKYFFNIYLTVIFLAPTILMIKYSEQYKGAWVYRLVSKDDIPLIFKGAYKGIFYKIMFPLYLFLSIIFVLICSPKVIPNLIVIFLSMIIVSLIALKGMDKHLPFSIPFKAGENMDDLGITFLVFFAVAILGGIHYFATFVWYGIYIYMIVQILLIALFWIYCFKVKKVKVKEETLNLNVN